MFLEKTLWRTFLFIFLSSFLTAAAMLYLKWEDLKGEIFTQLASTNQIIQTSTSAVLELQETVLTVVGHRLLELDGLHDNPQARSIITETLDQNPKLAGFGLADTDGNLVLTSSNLDRQSLPNLLEKPQTAKSFREALSTNNMVLGRTYYLPAAGVWLIPVRFRLKDRFGNTTAVMTTGFTINSEKSLFNVENLPESMNLLIARQDKDQFYRQFISGIKETDYDYMYNNPIDQFMVERFNEGLIRQNNLSVEDIKQRDEMFFGITQNYKNEDVLFAIHYIPKYKIFIIVSQSTASLIPELKTPGLWLFTLLFLFNTALFVIFKQIEKIQQRSKEDLKFQANHDPLTQLPNRNYLNKINYSWKKNGITHFSLAFLDLDNFKSANDFYGHRIGDLLLIEVAERLKQAFHTDLVLRLGGDEFIIMMLNEDEEVALPKLRHFLSKLSRTISIQDIDFSLTGSIGLTQYPKDGDSVEELLRKSDIAMYEAKRSRKDIVLFSSTLDEQQKFKTTLETELATALKNDEFFLVYQPQINASTGKIQGLETLIRWNNKKLGFVAPDQFITTAEATGHIIDIGQFVLDQSLKEISDFCLRLKKATELSFLHKEEMNLSVNISVQQLFHDDFVPMMSRYAHDKTPANIRLTVEITESLFIGDFEKAKAILSELRNQGILISLDDFGTGYSSLSSLNQLPIDELKVDKSFISDIDHNNQDLSLVQSIISIGNSLSIPVVAEGVETEAQATILSENHCDVFQGYLYSRPLKIDELLQFVENYQHKNESSAV